MHPELARLLRHACRRPDDPVAGLVLADWLEENGDESGRDRAQFIRSQRQLAALRPYHPERAAIARRAEALRTAHQDDWVGALADSAYTCDFHHGLITLLLREEANDEGALSALEKCPAFAWVTAVYCRGWKAKQVKELSDWPGLSQVGHLEVSGAGLNARALRPFQQSGRLAGIAALDLGTNSLGDAGAKAVADWEGQSTLTLLWLHQNGIGPAGAKALAASPHLAGLRALQLDNNVVGDEGLRALAHSGGLTGLQTLHLHDNEITTAGARAVLDAGGLAYLRVLGLGYNTLRPEGVEALARAPLLDHVEELLLRSTNAGNQGAAALVNAPLPRLRSLDLSHNGIGPSGAQAISLADWLPRLEALRLNGNGFGAEGARFLAQRAGGWALRALDLGSTGLKTDGVEALLRGGVLAGLEELNLGANAIDSAGARALAEFPWPGDPPWIDLRHNPFSEPVKALLRERLGGRVAV